MSFRLCFAVAVLALCFGAGAPRAEWPERPLRIIVPFAPGGSSDILARLIASGLQEPLKQPVIVENRAGANGGLGLQAAAQAPADGYTLVIGHIGTHAINPAVARNPGYDTARDFTTVAMVATASSVVVVPQQSAVRDVPGLLALARQRPGALSYGSPGVGSPSHVTVVLLARLTGIDVLHVPYRGGAPALTDLIAGTLDFMFAGPAEIAQHVQSGRLRALATSGADRSPGTPNLPTVAESGVPGYAFGVWHALSVRSGLPAAVLDRLRRDTAMVLASDITRARLRDLGLEPGMTDAEAANAFVRAEVVKWGTLARDAGIQAD
jgi:tripartite-type tricarboxylate transporter receptor subunit TctC